MDREELTKWSKRVKGGDEDDSKEFMERVRELIGLLELEIFKEEIQKTDLTGKVHIVKQIDKYPDFQLILTCRDKNPKGESHENATKS